MEENKQIAVSNGSGVGGGLFDLGVMSSNEASVYKLAEFRPISSSGTASAPVTRLTPDVVALAFANGGVFKQHEPVIDLFRGRQNKAAVPTIEQLPGDDLFERFRTFQDLINKAGQNTFTTIDEAQESLQAQKMALHPETASDFRLIASEMSAVAKLKVSLDIVEARSVDPELSNRLEEHFKLISATYIRLMQKAHVTDLAGWADAIVTERTEAQPSTAERQERELASSWRKADSALSQAALNRGRETNAFKALHEYLELLQDSNLDEASKKDRFAQAFDKLSRIKDWDKGQWFRKEQSNWRDPSGRRMTEYEFIRRRNDFTMEQMTPWDEWAREVTLPFRPTTDSAEQQIRALDDYLVRRVSVDSVKNWLRRRPDEPFINQLFSALAENKLYLSDDKLQLRSMKDGDGNVRPVEKRDGNLFFEGSDQAVPVKEDALGRYVELPDDSDMVVFERRTIKEQERIVPIALPNERDPNIQWFGGAQVKRGWGKEQRFLQGPQAFTAQELFGFFPEHFPMRVTNSVEAGKPTSKTGAAIYGFARDHAGRQARQLIAEYGEVMDGLKRNNSQLINDARNLFGLQRPRNPQPVAAPAPAQPE